MKKLIVMLVALLVTAPAMATVTITIVDNPDNCTADICYTVTGEPNNVRAFALNISVDAGVIEDVNNFHVGVSTQSSPGYGIFPASFRNYIEVDGDGNVTNWDDENYSPLADPNDPGTEGGLGTDRVTVELGSLYEGDANAPLPAGTLCTVKVSESCNMSVTLNSIRGNVVLEDASEPTVSLTGATDMPVACGGGPCFPTDHPDYDAWVALGSPECWCFPKQCHGDADGQQEKIGVLWYSVAYNDLDVLIGGWKQRTGAQPGICADFNHAEEKIGILWYKVGYDDLNILIQYWKSRNIPEDCLDVP